MANGTAPALTLRAADRVELERLVRSAIVPAAAAQRARIVLLAADGIANQMIAERVGVSRPTVNLWRARYTEKGLKGLADEPRPGRPRQVDLAAILAATLLPPPASLGVTHRSGTVGERCVRARSDRPALGDVTPEWTAESPLRIALDRRNAQVEIDALVALMLGVTADQLCTVYRTQFAVLRGYDQNVYFYDANGRLVPNPVLVAWRKKGDDISEAERTHTNQAGNTYVYELPFRTYDREADMRQAYAEFERRLAERS